jgi:hypothetical protein
MNESFSAASKTHPSLLGGHASTWYFSKLDIALPATVIGSFFLLQMFLRLRTTIILGADEGFELAKATLCLKGYHLYSEIWNDQPPLLTVLVTAVLRQLSPTALGPRLLTGSFAALLLGSFYGIVHRISGRWIAFLATLFVMASPGFLVLGSTCMLEVPALALAIAGLALLALLDRPQSCLPQICGGLAFGVSLETKLISVVLLPVAALILLTKARQDAFPFQGFARSLFFFAATIVVGTFATDWLSCNGAYLAHFHQSWTSHFGPLKSTDHGSPADHRFNWAALLRNWDVTIAAAGGICISLKRSKNDPLSLLPIAWLVLTFAIFGFHRPWWNYYYIHTSVPSCWCAAVGFSSSLQWALTHRRLPLLGLVSLALACAMVWMGARLFLEIREIRRSPQTFTSLFLPEIAKYKPFTEWIYSEEPIYSFYTGIPMPPDLAVVMLKRFWSGEITDERIVADLEDSKPGVILLVNNGRPKPYHALIESEYRIIYKDANHLLYIHKSIVNGPSRSQGVP